MVGFTGAGEPDHRRWIVLNAFRRHGRVHPGRGTATPGRVCAQRLSASWSGSLPDQAVERLLTPVLNAFRRHGRVHCDVKAITGMGELCSTPFGVMVGFTQRA